MSCCILEKIMPFQKLDMNLQEGLLRGGPWFSHD